MAVDLEHASLLVLLRRASAAHLLPASQIETAGSADAALAAKSLGQGDLLLEAELEAAAAELTAWAREGIRLVSVLDRDYPPNLRRVPDRPAAVFVAGALQADDRRAVAVIGSRRPTESGRRLAVDVASRLVDERFTVVSGLATGIDTTAHRTALTRGGRTIAVLGTGVRVCYPPQNALLQQRIADEGALVSQFLPDTRPTRSTFPLRNAVMSGVALANVIVEATSRSGARLQSRLALEHGRPVFVASALMTQEWARELARRPGVQVFSSAEQLPLGALDFPPSGCD